jgi:hypothetical protein
MYSERLLLRVSAAEAGWDSVEPPTITGASGVVHRFAFLASRGSLKIGFDVYDEIDEIRVIQSYLKKLDTGASVALVCQRVHSERASKLAAEYGMAILEPDRAESYLASCCAILEGRVFRSEA